MGNGDRYVHVYLGKAKRPWEEYCRRTGKKPGVGLKRLVEELLRETTREGRPPVTSPRAGEGTPDREPKARLELRVTASERARIQELAESEGCSPQQWMVNVVRATLTRQPQFGMRELQVLGESNYQLLAIGRNLNQITKHLNEGAPETVTSKQIEELKMVIDEHTDLASNAIRASVERWSVP
jgi:hypothetical protein